MLFIAFLFTYSYAPAQTTTGAYSSLVQLCKELRILERAGLPNGVPDYRQQTIVKTQQTLQQYNNRLSKLDTAGWSVEQKVDYVLLRAEMNALDYNCRILQPWVRDPAFYAILFNEQSDTPDHEGPTSFSAIELWKYVFPLSTEDEKKLVDSYRPVPAHAAGHDGGGRTSLSLVHLRVRAPAGAPHVGFAG